MNEWTEIIILAVVQGVTEFLPISSSGHLAILQRAFGITEDNLLISVTLHAGSLGSIVAYYARDLWRLLRERQWYVILLVAVATAPLVLLGYPLHKLVGYIGTNLWWVAAGYLCTFVLLVFVHRSVPREPVPLASLPRSRALLIGLAQCLAVLPGVSRSGTTISAASRTGLTGKNAARFSFFLGIPAIAGAALIEMKAVFLDGARPQVNPFCLVLGFLVSFAVGLVALATLIRILQQRRLTIFGWYCLLAAIAAILLELYTKGNAS